MNDYLFLIIGSVVTITCFYFMAAPFFAKRRHENNLVAYGGDPEMSLESIYQAINEIEMDLLMKKITQQDFRQMKDHLSIMAAEYLNNQPEKTEKPQQQIDEPPSDIDKQILSQLAEIRHEKGVGEG